MTHLSVSALLLFSVAVLQEGWAADKEGPVFSELLPAEATVWLQKGECWWEVSAGRVARVFCLDSGDPEANARIAERLPQVPVWLNPGDCAASVSGNQLEKWICSKVAEAAAEPEPWTPPQQEEPPAQAQAPTQAQAPAAPAVASPAVDPELQQLRDQFASLQGEMAATEQRVQELLGHNQELTAQLMQARGNLEQAVDRQRAEGARANECAARLSARSASPAAAQRIEELLGYNRDLTAHLMQTRADLQQAVAQQRSEGVRADECAAQMSGLSEKLDSAEKQLVAERADVAAWSEKLFNITEKWRAAEEQLAAPVAEEASKEDGGAAPKEQESD